MVTGKHFILTMPSQVTFTLSSIPFVIQTVCSTSLTCYRCLERHLSIPSHVWLCLWPDPARGRRDRPSLANVPDLTTMVGSSQFPSAGIRSAGLGRIIIHGTLGRPLESSCIVILTGADDPDRQLKPLVGQAIGGELQALECANSSPALRGSRSL